MTVIEMIIEGLRNPSAREQVEVARYVNSLNPKANQERAEGLKRLHGVLDEADGQAFEEAMKSAHRIEEHG